MRRSLSPREHGAYAQLGAPLVTALVLRTPTPAALLIAIAACCAFLANEPLLVVLGHRGARVRKSDGRRAMRRLVTLGLGTALATAIGLVLATRETVAIAGIAAMGAAAMVALAWRRAEHSLVGELIATIALPGASAPVAIASGVQWQLAVAVWAAWAVGYACSVVAVHRVLARHKRAASWLDAAVASGLAIVTVASCLLAGVIPAAGVAAPLAVISFGVAVHPPRATRLRAVGVALVIASLVSATISIAVV